MVGSILAREGSSPESQVKTLPSGRTVRLATGLTLFSYVICHFLSHATGVFRLEIMEAVGRGVLLAPWRTVVGQCVLFAAFLVHGTLGFSALVRRRHLRMPTLEAVQLGLGLLIPLLLIPHASNVRLGAILYGLDDSYYRLVYQYWLTSPARGLSRQFLLLVTVWVHGCIGLHMLLNFRPWYRRARAWLLGLVILIPVLAIMGINNAGWDVTLRSTLTPDFAARNGPPPAGTVDAQNRADLENLWDGLSVGYLALIACAFGYRALRQRFETRGGRVHIQYPNRPPVVVPRGFSILEASRWAGIPHTSVCGGRARCSTCRIEITAGHEHAPAPSDVERATLDRINAPANVRLACQLRPVQDIALSPLVRAHAGRAGSGLVSQGGAELTVTALAIDLRDSTRLGVDKLPFDTLFIIDRYIQRVSAAVTANGGFVVSIAGDGLMSVFGIDGDARRGALNALAAAGTIWEELDSLNLELTEDLKAPLRFGIGVHTGIAVIGSSGVSSSHAVRFLGDTGNVAARLEQENKRFGSTLIVSDTVLDAAGLLPPAELAGADVQLRGREDAPLSVRLVRDDNRMVFATLVAG
jgi:adenylate cyclase